MVSADQPAQNAHGAVALDVLRKPGMEVDYAVMDWGTLVQRRASKEPPAKGGWNMFITGRNGLDMTTLIANQMLRSNGAKAWFGWPDLPDLQALNEASLEAADPAAQRRIAADLQREALRQAIYFPTGQYFTHTAFRRDITGIAQGPLVFWNVRRGPG
jgi:peptide/nickel transport system substrate-binding protein